MVLLCRTEPRHLCHCTTHSWIIRRTSSNPITTPFVSGAVSTGTAVSKGTVTDAMLDTGEADREYSRTPSLSGRASGTKDKSSKASSRRWDSGAGGLPYLLRRVFERPEVRRRAADAALQGAIARPALVHERLVVAGAVHRLLNGLAEPLGEQHDLHRAVHLWASGKLGEVGEA